MYVEESTKKGINEDNLSKVTGIIKATATSLISKETDGILAKPKSNNEILEFNSTVEEIVENKLRARLGV